MPQYLTFFSVVRLRVLNLLLAGVTEEDVSAQLDMNANTVHWHVKKIYRSLTVHSRAELCARLLPLDLKLTKP
jgi:DNA-binding NarL/FixJ family response regulator